MRSANALRRRVSTLEGRQTVERTPMSDLELARRIAFVRVSEGRDLLGEVSPACSLGRPRGGDQAADRQRTRPNAMARSERPS